MFSALSRPDFLDRSLTTESLIADALHLHKGNLYKIIQDDFICGMASKLQQTPRHLLLPEELEKMRAYHREYARKNREKNILWQREYRKKHPEKNKESTRKWYRKNKKKHLSTGKKWCKKNRAKRNAEARAYQKANPEKMRHIAASRRAKKRNQQTEGVDFAIIKTFFNTAARLTKITGIEFEVDHLIPITRGGSHHQKNLMVMTGTLNRKKHTKTIEECRALPEFQQTMLMDRIL